MIDLKTNRVTHQDIGQMDINRIDLDNINTIVGKNESGKSNLIQTIGKLDLTRMNDTNYFKNSNKNNMKKPLISLVIVPYKSEKNIYKSILNQRYL